MSTTSTSDTRRSEGTAPASPATSRVHVSMKPIRTLNRLFADGDQAGQTAGGQMSGTKTAETRVLRARGMGAVRQLVVPIGIVVGVVAMSATPAFAASPKAQKHRTATTVTCSPSNVEAGTPVGCTATVNDTTASPTTPTGTVSFSSGAGTFSPTSCSLSGGSCTVSFTPSTAGADSVTANYAGDTNHAASSGTTTVTASARGSWSDVQCSPPRMLVGSPSTCQATVTDTSWGTASTPSGKVAFSSSGSAGTFSATSCTLSNGSCSVTFTPTAAGTATITATYTGDPGHAGSSAQASIGALVSKDHTSVAVGCPDSTPGTATWCNAEVSDATDGSSVPTGTVSFTTTLPGTFASNTCTLDGRGICSVQFTPSSPGTHTVTASYSGDAIDAASSATGPFNAYDPSSSAVTCSPTAMATGAAATCTATVTDNISSSTTPGGTFTWTSLGTANGSLSAPSCTLVAGSCSVTWTASGPGQVDLAGSYGGDAKHWPSTASAVTVTVGATTTTISCDGTAADGSSPTRCTATVTSPFGVVPTGTVRFSDGSLSNTGLWASTYPYPATCQLTNGSCTITYIPTATWQPTFEADYSGDANNAGSSGTTTQQVTTGVLSSSRTTVSCSPSTLSPSQATACTVTVTDTTTGTPVNDGSATFTSSGPGAFTRSSCSVLAGSCSVTFIPSSTGADAITAVYSGDRTHAANSGHTTVTVATSAPVGTTPDLLTAAGPGAAYYSVAVPLPWLCNVNLQLHFYVCSNWQGLRGSGFYDTATLTDATGRPLVGRTITFSAGAWSQTAVTDANGFASVVALPGASVGPTYTTDVQPAGYTVSFTGDATYEPATSTWP